MNFLDFEMKTKGNKNIYHSRSKFTPTCKIKFDMSNYLLVPNASHKTNSFPKPNKCFCTKSQKYNLNLNLFIDISSKINIKKHT